MCVPNKTKKGNKALQLPV